MQVLLGKQEVIFRNTLRVEAVDENGTVISAQDFTVNQSESSAHTISFTATTPNTTLRITNPSSTTSNSTDLRIDSASIAVSDSNNVNGNDTINAGAGDDSVDAGSGDDSIAGGAGADTLNAGAGNDTISVGTGDNASGGAGSDRFVIDTGNLNGGVITLNGGGDADTLDLSGLTYRFESLSETDGSQSGTLVITGQEGGDVTVNFSDIESITNGTLEGTVVTGTPNDDTLSGFGANDTISGLGSNDVISANGGDDSVDAGAGDDSVNAGAGNDSVSGRSWQ